MKRAFTSILTVLLALCTLTGARAQEKTFSDSQGGNSVEMSPEVRREARAIIESFRVKHFPRLPDDYRVLAQHTRRYNCIAHSLGIHDRWVNPMTGPRHNSLVHVDRLYAEQGYRRMPTFDVSLERGKQKVAVYVSVTPDGYVAQVTHAALQEKDGTWSSKLGGAPLIRHRTLEQLRGPSYGLPIAVYARARPAR